jgi:uncharacterized membrane protein YcaP (DUF421 family)
MPSWIAGPGGALVGVAGKAVLIYATAVIGLRIAHRRTLAQWTAIDFAAAVAVGAIIGRTALAGTQSYLMGAVALGTILLAHGAVTMARSNDILAKAVDHRVRVLVEHGRVRRRQLRICGLTEHDLAAQLRQGGVLDLSGVRYILYEAKGNLTVVPENSPADAPLVAEGLTAAAGWPPDDPRSPRP